MKKLAFFVALLFSGLTQAYEVIYLNCEAENGTTIHFEGNESTWVPPINVPRATLNGFSKNFMFGVVQIHSGKNLLTIGLTEMSRPHSYNFEIALEGKVKLNRRHSAKGIIYRDSDEYWASASMEMRRTYSNSTNIVCEYELFEQNPRRIDL